MPRMKSMFRLRSWASSTMIVSYCSSDRSFCSSASRMPSVITLTRVSADDLVAESHLVADGRAEFGADLLGDAVGDRTGGDPARLRVADQPVDAATEFEADLRQLGRLARAGLAGHDHHLVVADRRGDVVLALGDRQFRRVRDGRHCGGSGGPATDRGLDGGRDRVDCAGLRRTASALDAFDPATDASTIAQGQLGQSGDEPRDIRRGDSVRCRRWRGRRLLATHDAGKHRRDGPGTDQ